MSNLKLKIGLMSLTLFVFFWWSTRTFFPGKIPEEIMQDLSYWILLIIIIFSKILYKTKTVYYLYMFIIFLFFGAIFSMAGMSAIAEVALRLGFVFLLVGSIFVFFEKPNTEKK